MPLESELQTNRSWDALADSLWEGLRTLPARQVAIVWEGAVMMREMLPED